MRIRKRFLQILLPGFLLMLVYPTLLVGGEAIVPSQPIKLFNGKDLSNFYTWIVNHSKSDPLRVFTVVEEIDGAAAIRVSGENWGGLVTNEEFHDYRLVVEFRWGLPTWGVRKGSARDSGVLVHSQGRDGNTREDFNGPWMRSMEAQIIEGGVGDFISIPGYDEDGTQSSPAFTITARKPENDQPYFDPRGEKIRIERWRVNWFGRDPNWKDVIGFRGAKDVESPEGQWTTMEVVCDGSSVTNIVNGVVVNALTECAYTEGKIQFQSEGAEIYFRRIELLPLH